MHNELIILAERFENGDWNYYEHACDEEEAKAVWDSAIAKAFDRGSFNGPSYIDYLRGAEYLFNVFYGDPDNPISGDTKVFGIQVNEIMIARYVELRTHFVNKRVA